MHLTVTFFLAALIAGPQLGLCGHGGRGGQEQEDGGMPTPDGHDVLMHLLDLYHQSQDQGNEWDEEKEKEMADEHEYWKWNPPHPCRIRNDSRITYVKECEHGLHCNMGPITTRVNDRDLELTFCSYPSRYLGFHACRVQNATGGELRKDQCPDDPEDRDCNLGPLSILYGPNQTQYSLTYCNSILEQWDKPKTVVDRACRVMVDGWQTLQRRCPPGYKCSHMIKPKATEVQNSEKTEVFVCKRGPEEPETSDELPEDMKLNEVLGYLIYHMVERMAMGEGEISPMETKLMMKLKKRMMENDGKLEGKNDEENFLIAVTMGLLKSQYIVKNQKQVMMEHLVKSMHALVKEKKKNHMMAELMHKVVSHAKETKSKAQEKIEYLAKNMMMMMMQKMKEKKEDDEEDMGMEDLVHGLLWHMKMKKEKEEESAEEKEGMAGKMMHMMLKKMMQKKEQKEKAEKMSGMVKLMMMLMKGEEDSEEEKEGGMMGMMKKLMMMKKKMKGGRRGGRSSSEESTDDSSEDHGEHADSVKLVMGLMKHMMGKKMEKKQQEEQDMEVMKMMMKFMMKMMMMKKEKESRESQMASMESQMASMESGMDGGNSEMGGMGGGMKYKWEDNKKALYVILEYMIDVAKQRDDGGRIFKLDMLKNFLGYISYASEQMEGSSEEMMGGSKEKQGGMKMLGKLMKMMGKKEKNEESDEEGDMMMKMMKHMMGEKKEASEEDSMEKMMGGKDSEEEEEDGMMKMIKMMMMGKKKKEEKKDKMGMLMKMLMGGKQGGSSSDESMMGSMQDGSSEEEEEEEMGDVRLYMLGCMLQLMMGEEPEKASTDLKMLGGLISHMMGKDKKDPEKAATWKLMRHVLINVYHDWSDDKKVSQQNEVALVTLFNYIKEKIQKSH